MIKWIGNNIENRKLEIEIENENANLGFLELLVLLIDPRNQSQTFLPLPFPRQLLGHPHVDLLLLFSHMTMCRLHKLVI